MLGLAVLGSRLYVTHGSSPNLALGWFPTDCSGGAAGIQAFAPEREGLSSIVAAGTAIYWTEKASIVKCDNPPSCTGATFAGGLDSHPGALASDASSLYWMTAAGIFSCPLSGCVVGPKRLSCEGCPTDDYASSSRMPSLAVDDAYVYAGCPGRGRVIRVAK